MIGRRAHCLFPVAEASQIGSVRRAVNEAARQAGLMQEKIAKAEIVANELATNLIKHATGGGEVLLGYVDAEGDAGLELIALDQGPGMANVNCMLENGVSTTGTIGGGLGAVKRLSDEFDIHSCPARGTAIFSRLWSQNSFNKPQQPQLEVGGVMLPLPGQSSCGDGWAVAYGDRKTTILLADGLGHGDKAAEAAAEAIAVFEANKWAAPGELIEKIHDALKHTQGAAVAAASIDLASGILTYSGVGNLSGRLILKEESRGCVSVPGGCGFQLNRVQEFSYPFSGEAMLVMNSDGLFSSIETGGLANHRSSLIAAIIWRNFKRGTDDATIVVAKARR